MNWKKIGESKVLDHPRMHLVEDDVVLPNGEKTKYLREVDRPDYVTVIVRHAGKIAMIYDYSYPNDQMLLQFPEGLPEEDETFEEGAARELEEETGLHTRRVKEIGQNLHNHRRNTNSNHVMLAEDIEDTGETHLEATEHGLETIWLTEEEIWQKIAAEGVIQKNTLAAWSIYQAWCRGETA
jgi:ADP-ribose pyrophosphatase